jgi:pimeloyl-ACP methyl ester carboxylesterase
MTDKLFNTDSFSLAAKTWGTACQPKILALHGWLDNAASFDALATLLADNYYIVALDLPGHGLSEHTQDDYYPFLNYVTAVHQVIQQLNWQQFVLLGHSMGGSIASVISRQLPDQVTALISLDAIGPLSIEIMENSSAISMTTRLISQAQKRPRTRYNSLQQMAERRAKMNQVDSAKIMPLIERGVEKCNNYYLWRFDPKLLQVTQKYMTELEVKNILQNIQCPVLIVEASDGLLIDNKIVDERKQYFTHLSVAQLAGGHHLHLDQADTVYQSILSFFQANDLT